MFRGLSKYFEVATCLYKSFNSDTAIGAIFSFFSFLSCVHNQGNNLLPLPYLPSPHQILFLPIYFVGSSLGILMKSLPEIQSLNKFCLWVGFPSWLSGKEFSWNVGDSGLIPELGRFPEEGTTPVFLPGKSYGQKNLLSYSPWGHKSVGHGLVTKQQEWIRVWIYKMKKFQK